MTFKCQDCGKQWYYDVQKCIFCKGDVVNVATGRSTVRGGTRIDIPSPGHSRVPYYDLLLEDEHGNFHIRKSFTECALGTVIEAEAVREIPERIVGVVGAGTMGSGIAQVCAQIGYRVILSDISEFYDDQLKATIKAVTSAIEPLMIVIMGGIVAFIAASILLPIFKMSQLVK